MSAEPSLDPFALIRTLVGTVEKRLNETARPIVGSSEFSRVANRLLRNISIAKKLAQGLRQRSFELLNIPSRADIVALADRLQALEDRIIGVQAALDQAEGATQRAKQTRPGRTKKPPQATGAEVAPAPPVPATPSQARKPARTRKPAQ